jgi:glycosyltransferase involved in cell wall biosynthesis
LPSIIGLASLEAMAMGKVAISTFDPQYRPYYPGCPVITIEPTVDALKDAVRSSVKDLPGARARGLAGREYVVRNHSADEIVRRIMPIYESLVKA